MTKYDFPRSVAVAVGATIVAGALCTGIPAYAAGQPSVPEAQPAHPGVPASLTTPAPAPAGAIAAGRPVAAEADAPDRSNAGFRLGSVSALLRVAEQQIGVRENASGGGTPFHRWYMDSPWAKQTAARDGGSPLEYANAPWCAMFVSWVGEKAGLRSSIGGDAYTVTYAEWFKDNGHWGNKATPGAVVFYAWDGSKSIDSIDHVGFVKKDNGDGTITTIEGNTGDGEVEQRVRPKSDVVGYGYPQYRS